MKIIKWILLVIIFPLVLAYPTWHYYLKDKFYLPGPIYSTPDDYLENILKNSHIIEELDSYQLYVIKPALSIRLKGNRYFGPEGYSFQKERLYIGLLKNIMELNKNEIGMILCEKDNKIIIFVKSQIEELN